MNNRIPDLINILFETVETLNDRDISGEDLKEEIERSKAISNVAEKITDNAKLQLSAAEMAVNYGIEAVPQVLLGVKNDN